MMKNRDNILKEINVNRMANDLWRLVNIPSPTCRERKAALAFAEMLSEAGAEVEIDETIYESPSIIGRLKGNLPGKTFQLAGHIDHIDVPHVAPSRNNNIISGRGSADMKNGLAGILEIVRVLKKNGCNFPGKVLVTVYGLHEAPLGTSAGILNLIKRNVMGDAALVAESEYSTEDKAVIMGKGQSIWNITIRRHGKVCHELNRPACADNLLSTSMKIIKKLQGYSLKLQLKKNGYKLLNPESFFIGQVHYGDFYNRVPTKCTLQGTRRWNPCHNFKEIKQGLNEFLADIILPAGISFNCKWNFVGESYEINPDEMVVKAFQKAYKTVTGKSIKPAGISIVSDVNHLARLGNVPTVLCGFDNRFAHAEYEHIRIKQLLMSCQTALITLLNYLSLSRMEKSNE